MSKANIDELYSLRRDFTIIGVTGRVGSGCSEISSILSSDFQLLPIIYSSSSQKSIQTKKRELVYDFCRKNWKKYNVIEYKKVLLFLLLPDLIGNQENTLLFDYYRYRLKEVPDIDQIQFLKKEFEEIILRNKELILKIKASNIKSSTSNKSLRKLKDIGVLFWGSEFNNLAKEINDLLFKNSFVARKMLLHHIANNYRASGKPFRVRNVNSEYVFYIAKAINKIIKATKSMNDECHVVIDSLKNSLEINFFRERYSAFYMIAVKNDLRHFEIPKKYSTENNKDIKRLIEMDDAEYSSSDYSKGDFYVPDVQNCIQISDYHINIRKGGFVPIQDNQKHSETFFTLNEQLYKLQALIQQPGLITPEPIERVMQLAFTARLNSGCISRQVGAAVTDKNFSIKAIGWNDVPKGATPCSLRNAKEINSDGFGFTNFEKGFGIKETEVISENSEQKELDKESIEFNTFVTNFFSEANFSKNDLNGRNCPYCFKSAYNSFKGDKNQVHTRSLHAEENAMLQISKFGGQALEGGYLFTTASTCELCAKKAYQLGIKSIYYIDPYPGISRNHILKSNEKTDPEMILFSGAVGRAYLKFYEPFMPQKDELTLISGKKMKEPGIVTKRKLKDILMDIIENDHEMKEKLDEVFENDNTTNRKLLELLKKGLDK